MDIRGVYFAVGYIMRAFLTKRCHAIVPMINKNKELIVAQMKCVNTKMARENK